MPPSTSSYPAPDLASSRAGIRATNHDQVQPPVEPIPEVPAWIECLTGVPSSGHAERIEDLIVRRGQDAALFSITITDATALSADELESRVEMAYSTIADAVSGAPVPLYPVRFWNFIPDIHEAQHIVSEPESPKVITRYMVFNAGRYRAMESWRKRARGSLEGGVAAATGIGYRGTDLAIHALAIAAPGRAVENPRQIPAYRYSTRFGPLPPCFARGTTVRMAGGPVLIVSGTASVRGEESVHRPSHGRSHRATLLAQVDETLANMESLIGAGFSPSLREPLGSLIDLRVYHTHPEDALTITERLRPAIDPSARIEFVRADVCRPELVVEIEGLAANPATRAR